VALEKSQGHFAASPGIVNHSAGGIHLRYASSIDPGPGYDGGRNLLWTEDRSPSFS